MFGHLRTGRVRLGMNTLGGHFIASVAVRHGGVFFNTGICAFFTLTAGIATDLKKVMR
jgi:hypothetical protein